MEVRAKKALGQHFLTDQRIAAAIVGSLLLDWAHEASSAPEGSGTASSSGASVLGPELDGTVPAPEASAPADVLEVGPGTGVLTQYLLERKDLNLRMVELDGESVEYLLAHFPGMQGRLLQADFLRLPLERIFPDRFAVIGNFPYNISSQIFFRILDYRDRVPEVVCMIQKEVAERLAAPPGSKTYGILSVLLQMWYDIDFLFGVGPGSFVPPPKVDSAVIRLRRNARTDPGCDEALFRTVVKTAFGQRRKMMRSPLKPLAREKARREGWDEGALTAFLSDPVFSLRPEQLSVEDFIGLTRLLS